MPLYEYYCEDCDGIFELIRPVSQSSNPQPCPVCDGDGERLMPTQVHAFTMRGGMPRRIPDQGLFWTTKGQSTKPMQTSDMKKMEPFLVKEERNPRASTQLTPEELEAGAAPPLEVRERVRGSKSRGRRLAERSASKDR
jgi:putative FmdB family regulatory protein